MFSRLAFQREIRKIIPKASWPYFNFGHRYLSSKSHRIEIVPVPVGGNGTVLLEISRPIRAANHNNVLLYLPPGPLLTGQTQALDAHLNVEDLKEALPTTTIVELQYRLTLRSTRPTAPSQKEHAADHRFPTPVHDVFAAWDYVTDSLELHNHGIADGQTVYYEPKISLYGSHIGGALALSLALTNPNLITAVAVQNVVTDWAGIDELAAIDAEDRKDVEGEKRTKRDLKRHTEKRRMKNAARQLMKLRAQLFRTHSGYFDAFASPTLFLRAPGRDTPIDKLLCGEDVDEMVVRYGDGQNDIGVVEVNREGYGPYDDDWHARESGNGYDARKDEQHPAMQNVRDSIVLDDSISSNERYTNGHDVLEPAALSTTNASSPVSQANEVRRLDVLSPSSSDGVPQGSTEVSLMLGSPPRRRKVLRRWPPIAQPDDVLLPYVNIFLTGSSLPFSESGDRLISDSTDIKPVVHLQCREIQDLLQRACFWGREKGLAEERVVLTDFGDSAQDKGSKEGDMQSSLMNNQKSIAEWLSMRFQE